MNDIFIWMKHARTPYMLLLEKERFKDLKEQKEREYQNRFRKVYFTGNKTVYDEEGDDEFLEI